ncbi:preprotein translocase subunit SecY [candidate division WWE3 bacterium RBG_19FT_COMBO_53_11]|uniref:Protein translocase subunit SecY n=1 Tax=candidate division WWE3 bacterium RBG_19FT_COMBO_53_11 TaxID=1802613 RepID=A0A1F4UH79_UNCKA|nr:MAG: preprotein translocase subunit SecY [candidate division WWE3 bacterium RBG_19FT_COMBO_53_11]
MIEALKRIWYQKELRNRIVFTIIAIVIFRFLAHIPLPGVDRVQLRQLFSGNALLGLLSAFSGGTMENFSVVSLGLAPYINASIIFQLLTFGFPKLKELSQEGEWGQAKINQYTRLLTLPLSIMQGYGFFFLLRQQGVVTAPTLLSLVALVLALSAGSLFMMWLGELLSERGIGNGISLLIFVGIAAGYPLSLAQSLTALTAGQVTNLVLFIVLLLGLFAAVVLINEAVRRIPIQYAVRGPNAGAQSFLPLRLNQAGVIPIIFAVSLVLIPPTIARYLSGIGNPQLAQLSSEIIRLFTPTGFFYNLVYFTLVVLFTFFYTAVVFNTKDLAENLQKRGGFIPGIRPGMATKDLIDRIITRTTFFGAIFLGLIAILPSVGAALTGVNAFTLGGTGILIVVSVVLETLRQLEGELSVREYDGYL